VVRELLKSVVIFSGVTKVCKFFSVTMSLETKALFSTREKFMTITLSKEYKKERKETKNKGME
jgi:hypothetical protein